MIGKRFNIAVSPDGRPRALGAPTFQRGLRHSLQVHAHRVILQAVRP
jgi:hypothetical protein